MGVSVTCGHQRVLFDSGSGLGSAHWRNRPKLRLRPGIPQHTRLRIQRVGSGPRSRLGPAATAKNELFASTEREFNDVAGNVIYASTPESNQQRRQQQEERERQQQPEIRWGVNLKHWSPSPEQWHAAMRLVCKSEQQKILSNHFLEDAKAKLAGQLLIRRLYGSVVGFSEGHNIIPKVTRLQSGRPIIDDFPQDLEFSIAHDGNWVLLTASRRHAKVGCDVVKTTRKTRLERLKGIFTPDELKQVSSVDDNALRRIRLMRRWAIKEAVTKALGVGLRFGMANVKVVIENEPESLQQEALSTSLDDGKEQVRTRTPLALFLSNEVEAVDAQPNNEPQPLHTSSPSSMRISVQLDTPPEIETGELDLKLEDIPPNWVIQMGSLDSEHLWALARGSYDEEHHERLEHQQIRQTSERDCYLSRNAVIEPVPIQSLLE